jgi:hypothetical protein
MVAVRTFDRWWWQVGRAGETVVVEMHWGRKIALASGDPLGLYAAIEVAREQSVVTDAPAETVTVPG